MESTNEIELCQDEQLRLAYLRAGQQGQVVLLLHGLGGFKELWWSTLLALAPGYQAFALDMPGHGGSPLAGPGHMLDLAGIVAAFCASKGFEQIVLIGHSMGGNIALELALLQPGLVSRLVLVDAADTSVALPYLREHLGRPYAWPFMRFTQAIRRLIEPLGNRVPHRHRRGLLLPWLRRSAYQARHDPNAQQALTVGLFANGIGQRAAAIQVPTLVITGQFDLLVLPTYARQLAATIPGAQYVVVRGAMHNPMDEQPEAFERALLSFLTHAER